MKKLLILLTMNLIMASANADTNLSCESGAAQREVCVKILQENFKNGEEPEPITVDRDYKMKCMLGEYDHYKVTTRADSLPMLYNATLKLRVIKTTFGNREREDRIALLLPDNTALWYGQADAVDLTHSWYSSGNSTNFWIYPRAEVTADVLDFAMHVLQYTVYGNQIIIQRKYYEQQKSENWNLARMDYCYEVK